MVNPITAPIIVAALLGLRHALEPDHLMAVAGLGVDGETPDARRMAVTGLMWGLGHAVVFSAAGLIILSMGWVPGHGAQQTGERLVGVMIAFIAGRVLIRRVAPTLSATAGGLTRATAWRTALGVGGMHGLVGTGGVALLLLPLVPPAVAAPALLTFAAMTAISMLVCSLVLGRVFAVASLRQWITRRGAVAVSAIGLVFGLWYAATA